MKWMFLTLFIFYALNISYGGVFDDRYPSARAAGISQAAVATANDVWAPYYNPAGLSGVQQYEAGMAYQRPFNLSFFYNGFIGAAMPLPGQFGAAALNIEGFGVDYNGATLSSENTFTLSHGFYLLDDIHSSLSLGYNLKYYYWDLGESVEGQTLGSSGVFGMDVGLQASIYTRTMVGVYAYNINSPTMGAEAAHDLPRRIVIGAAYQPYSGLTSSIAMNKTLGFDTQVEGGFEVDMVEFLTLRLGASTNPSRFSFGLGLNYIGVHFDYGFRNHPVLAETHTFGLRYRFGGEGR